MEVLEKEKAKGKDAAKGLVRLSLNEIYLLNKAVEELIQACPTIKLHVATRLFETKGNLENIVGEFDKKQQAVLKKYVKIGKDGKLMTKLVSGKQEWDYKRKKDKELAEKEMNKMFHEKYEEVKLEKFAESEIAMLEINPFKTQAIFMPGQPQQAPEVTKVHFIMDLFLKHLILK